jgi:hypothetical protein
MMDSHISGNNQLRSAYEKRGENSYSNFWKISLLKKSYTIPSNFLLNPLVIFVNGNIRVYENGHELMAEHLSYFTMKQHQKKGEYKSSYSYIYLQILRQPIIKLIEKKYVS